MTDTTLYQAAIVSPVVNSGRDARLSLAAIVTLCQEAPPKAGGALVPMVAVVSISKEFVIPITYLPYNLGAYMQTMPYYVGEF